LTPPRPDPDDRAMNPLKIVALVLGGIVALLVAAVAAVVLLVDPNDYRATIEQRVAGVTGRALRIEGDLGLDLFPWIALDVGRITLGNAPGFGDAPFLTAERTRVGARLLPLLRGRLEARRISVEGLQVGLITRADGRTNWQDLVDRPTSSTTADTGPTAQELSIAGLDLTGATLTLQDDGERTTTRVRELEVRTGAIGGTSPVDLRVAGLLDAGDGTAATRFAVDGDAAIDLAGSRATFRDLAIEGERIAAPATPSAATAFRVTTAELQYDWGAGALAPATLDVRWGELPMTVEVRGERLTGDRVITGRVRVPEFSPRAVLPSLGLALPPTRDPQAFGRAGFEGRFRVTPDALRIDELAATLDRSKIRGTAGIADLATGALAFDLTVDAIDLDAYRGPFAPGIDRRGAPGAPRATGATDATDARAAPRAAAAAPTPIPFDRLRTLRVDGRLAIGRASLAGLTLTDVQLPIDARAGDLRFQPRARLFGGTLGGRGVRLDARRSPARLEIAHEIRGIDVGAAVKAYADSDRLSGRADVQLALAGGGTTDAALLDALRGPVTFTVTDGALEGVDLTYELQRAQAVFRGQPLPARRGPPRTAFRALSGESVLANGVVTSDPLRLETDVLEVRGKGTFRLADQAVDYRLTAVVREAPGTDGAGAALADLRTLRIPLTVTGTVQDYSVRPDVSELAKARVRQELEKRGDEVKQKLRDRLDKLLGR
jgi:AsmA protein